MTRKACRVFGSLFGCSFTGRLAAIFALAAAVPCAQAADVVWQAVGGDYNGLFTDTTHWSAGRVPTCPDKLYTPNGGTISATISFPKGEVLNTACWSLRSGTSSVITLDGRGTTFLQPANDAGYDQWASGKFNNVVNLERNSGGEQLKKAGLWFNDFVCVLSNNYHAILKQGTFDFSRNGGRNTFFTSGANEFSSLRIETAATYLAANTFDLRSYCAHTLVDVAGGTLRGNTLNSPTSEGYLISGVSTHYTDFDVRMGGTAVFSGGWNVGNHAEKSVGRVFTLTVQDADSSLSVAGSLVHAFGTFDLNQSGGTLSVKSVCVANDTSANGANAVSHVNLTGGELLCNYLRAQSVGSAYLTANGGTLRTRAELTTDKFIEGFKTAKLGSAGLTLDIGHAVTVAQSFTDLDGQSGKLVKTGAGTLTLTGTDSTFGSLDVCDGKVVVDAAARVRTVLTVKGGARAQLGAANELTGLTLGDATTSGTLPLTVGAPIAVLGPVSFPRPQFVLSGTMAVDSTNTLLTATGDCTAAKAAWAAYVFTQGTESGKAYLPLATTDADTGVTSFKVAVSAAPNVTKIVTDDETAETRVDVTSYGTYDVTVNGTKVYTMAGGLKAGHLVKRGEGAVSVPLTLLDIWSELILSDGVLVLTGTEEGRLGGSLVVNKPAGTTVVRTEADTVLSSMRVTSGGWIKHGPGTLTIENDGSAVQTLTATNGCVTSNGTPGGTVVRVGQAFAPPVTSWTGLSVAEGTLCLKGTKPNAKFDLKHAVAVGMPTPDVAVTPRLLVDNCEAYTGNNSYHFMIAPNVWGTNWQQHGGRNAEVELVNGAKMRVDTLCMGDSASAGVGDARPKLTVDNSTFLSGFKLQFSRADVPGYRSQVVARNGARLLTKFSDLAQRTSAGIEVQGGIDLLVDGSVLACGSSYAATPTALTAYYSGGGHVSTNIFQNGAEFWCMQLVTSSDLRSALFAFDNATWRFDDGTNLCFSATSDGAVTFQARTGGLRFNASKDVRVQHPFVGPGTFRKTGSGTVWFDTAARYTSSGSVARTNPVTLACDVEVAEGALAVSPGAASGTNCVTLAEGTFLDLRGVSVGGLVLAGQGTVKNGTLDAPILRAAVGDADTVVTLAADAAVSGVARVDLGSALCEPYPENVVVAKYAGTAPDCSAWKLYNHPGAVRLRGTFTATDGEVRVSVYRSGLLVFIR